MIIIYLYRIQLGLLSKKRNMTKGNAALDFFKIRLHVECTRS